MVALERKRECLFIHHPTIICVLKTRKITRWYESDVPWGQLNDEGETEPEGVDDSDEDDGQDD
jgi:hypothetical protein